MPADGATLLSGQGLRDLGIVGAVDGDCFDWVLRDAAGGGLVLAIAERVGGLGLAATETDLLKGLYEDLIDPAHRHDLGEHYTPDWLAQRICAAVLDNPLHQRVMDPACGSGTFLFHALRRILAAAVTAGRTPAEAVMLACRNVSGLDVHPVAVIFARATCLLALLPELTRAAGRPPAVRIAVQLGDALHGTGADPPRFEVVIGNPPWLPYRAMSPVMQARFRQDMQTLGLWGGLSSVPAYDLSAGFFARSVQLYLEPAGTIAFVMPYAALTRKPFARFRQGTFKGRGADRRHVRFTAAWAFPAGVQPLFPVPACVLFAVPATAPQPPPQSITCFAGTLPRRDADPDEATRCLRVFEEPWPADACDRSGSAYRKTFRQGAILIPRRLVLVEPVAAGVRGRTGARDKQPWKHLEPPWAVVEAGFVYPVVLGETIAPFRPLYPVQGVIPIEDRAAGDLLSSDMAARRGFPGLSRWLAQVEALWQCHGKGTRSFLAQLDFFGQLSGQFPLAPLRVVYSKAGTLPAAAILRNPRAVIDHKLYWAAVTDEAEAYYLAAILNSETIRVRAEQWQSQGQWGARDFDKVAFNLPIPRFEPGTPLHTALAEAGREAETLAASVPLPPGEPFTRSRSHIRAACTAAGVMGRLEERVKRLLDG
jgi:hypothetical protein